MWELPLVVLMLVWARRLDPDTTRWLWLAGTGILVFLTNPQWRFPNRDFPEVAWTPLQQIVGGAYPIWSLIALMVIGRSAPRLGQADKVTTR